MAKQSKPRLVKDFDKLPKDIIARIKAEYPNGFSHKMISYTTPKGEKVMALPYETEDVNYLVRVNVFDTKNVVRGEDDDLDDDKALRDDLNLDGLDLDGLKNEDEDSVSDDDDEEEDDMSEEEDEDEEGLGVGAEGGEEEDEL